MVCDHFRIIDFRDNQARSSNLLHFFSQNAGRGEWTLFLNHDLIGPNAYAHCFHYRVLGKLFDVPAIRTTVQDESVGCGNDLKITNATAEHALNANLKVLQHIVAGSRCDRATLGVDQG
jgi:hypothetical protein